MRHYGRALFALICLGFGATGCTMTNAQLGLGQSADAERHPFLAAANATPVQKGQVHYRDGSYGLAEKHFRVAVERDPSNAEAWLGLAASYDQLRRFDHAGRAYDSVIRLIGHTPALLNNLGYHYYLQGNKKSALQSWERALEADPDNKHVINNIALVRQDNESDGQLHNPVKG